MTFEFQPTGVCSRNIALKMNGHTIEEVRFLGGCNGNLKGIASLVRGQKAEDVIQRCKGICCGEKGTSCPDQLSKALEAYLDEAE